MVDISSCVKSDEFIDTKYSRSVNSRMTYLQKIGGAQSILCPPPHDFERQVKFKSRYFSFFFWVGVGGWFIKQNSIDNQAD